MTATSFQKPARRPKAGVVWLPLLGLALVACTGSGSTPNPAHGWSEAGSPKQLEVRPAEYRHDVQFATDSARIDTTEQADLRRFLAAIQPRPSDTIRIEGHADERASNQYNLDLSARRARAVQHLLRDLGLNEVEIHIAAYGEFAPEELGSDPRVWRENRRVEVVVDRRVVVLPPCPDWSRESGTDFSNGPPSNFGCATQTNLGLMIADPRDLERGEKLGPADGQREADAVARYRQGKVTELSEEGIE